MNIEKLSKGEIEILLHKETIKIKELFEQGKITLQESIAGYQKIKDIKKQLKL